MTHIIEYCRDDYEVLKQLTETSIGVLVFDSFSPVLAEEHISRESPLWCFGILLGLSLGSLVILLNGFTLEKPRE